MRIRFGDTGEIYHITGERRQFWLFDKNGEPGRAVKGSDAYEILDGDGDEFGTGKQVPSYHDIVVRDELDGLDEAEEVEEFSNIVQDGDEAESLEDSNDN